MPHRQGPWSRDIAAIAQAKTGVKIQEIMDATRPCDGQANDVGRREGTLTIDACRAGARCQRRRCLLSGFVDCAGVPRRGWSGHNQSKSSATSSIRPAAMALRVALRLLTRLVASRFKQAAPRRLPLSLLIAATARRRSWVRGRARASGIDRVVPSVRFAEFVGGTWNRSIGTWAGPAAPDSEPRARRARPAPAHPGPKAKVAKPAADEA
jgi:hypothetical protein